MELCGCPSDSITRHVEHRKCMQLLQTYIEDV